MPCASNSMTLCWCRMYGCANDVGQPNSGSKCHPKLQRVILTIGRSHCHTMDSQARLSLRRGFFAIFQALLIAHRCKPKRVLLRLESVLMFSRH